MCFIDYKTFSLNLQNTIMTVIITLNNIVKH